MPQVVLSAEDSLVLILKFRNETTHRQRNAAAQKLNLILVYVLYDPKFRSFRFDKSHLLNYPALLLIETANCRQSDRDESWLKMREHELGLGFDLARVSTVCSIFASDRAWCLTAVCVLLGREEMTLKAVAPNLHLFPKK